MSMQYRTRGKRKSDIKLYKNGNSLVFKLKKKLLQK